MTPLERRYRRLLRLHPAGTRREELLGTLLDIAPEDRTRPGWSDTTDILRFALRQRLGLGPAQPLAVLASLMGSFALGCAAALSLICVIYGETKPSNTPGEGLGTSQTFGPFFTTGVLVYALTLASVVASLHRSAGQVLVGTALVVTVALGLFGRLTSPERPPMYLLAILGTLLLLALARATPLHKTSWIQLGVAFAVTIALCLVKLGTPLAGHGFGFYRDMEGLRGTAPSIGTALLMGCALALVKAGRDWRWLFAYLAFAAAWLPLFVTVRASPRTGAWAFIVSVGTVATACLLLSAGRRWTVVRVDQRPGL